MISVIKVAIFTHAASADADWSQGPRDLEHFLTNRLP
jgi:hypothetical protein